MTALLGAIADDLTGATDLAGTLVAAGVRTVQMIGVPAGEWPDDAEAVVVALKSRTAPAAVAVAESIDAARWLRRAGCRRSYFEYCSTFDSMPRGNIGPVAEALMRELGVDFTVACPAFPANGRTVYQGHLFVGHDLLSDSGMASHPLTPMTDANLVRVLGRQATGPVGLINRATVARGAEAVRARIADLTRESHGLAIADAIADEDLATLASACAGLPLVTGASGLARGLADRLRLDGRLAARPASRLPPTGGRRAVLAGSCSPATRAQVASMAALAPAFQLDPNRARRRRRRRAGAGMGRRPAGRPSAAHLLDRRTR